MWMFDGHLDLAMNALLYDRDLTQSVAAIRQREAAVTDEEPGLCTLTLPEMAAAKVRLCTGTLIARVRDQPAERKPLRHDLDFVSPAIAHSVVMGQLAWYHEMQRLGQLRIIDHQRALAAHLAATDDLLGVILMMEGADPIVTPEQVHGWFTRGLRCLSLAHFGPGRHALGTHSPEVADTGLTELGRELLGQMNGLPMMLDLTHLSDASLFAALDHFRGAVCATHANCRALSNSQRQLTDDMIRQIAQRGGVIGVVMHDQMLRHIDPATRPTYRQDISLETVADHIDHIAQVTGSLQHAALGSDLDGGFGAERCPLGLDTIADLPKLEAVLRRRGYGDEEIAGIFHENWLRLWKRVLPG
jgi:membrane dipeptidase